MPRKSEERAFAEAINRLERSRNKPTAVERYIEQERSVIKDLVHEIFDFGRPAMVGGGGSFGNAGAVGEWEPDPNTGSPSFEPVVAQVWEPNNCWSVCGGEIDCRVKTVENDSPTFFASVGTPYDLLGSASSNICGNFNQCPTKITEYSGQNCSAPSYTQNWNGHSYAFRNSVVPVVKNSAFPCSSTSQWYSETVCIWQKVCATSDPPETLETTVLPPPDDPNREKHKPVEDEDQGESREFDFPPWRVEFVPILPPFLAPIPPTPPTPRSPRPRRSKDKKVRSRIGQIMRFIDGISEGAEVVDSIFRALPCEVQKECRKNFRREQAFLDKAGQFGIELADQKAACIYDHFDRVDAALALSNIFRNEIEDRLYGTAAKHAGKGGLKATQFGTQFYNEARKRQENKSAAADGRRPADIENLTPFNDVVSYVLDVATETFGLVPERKC